MGNSAGSHTRPPRMEAFGARGRSLSEVRWLSQGPSPRLSGETCGGTGGRIRCLGPLRSQHLLREFVFINVRGRAALPPDLKAPCSSRKARAGGLRWAGSSLPCSELAGSPRVFPNRWVQILLHPGLIHAKLGLSDFPGGGGGRVT